MRVEAPLGELTVVVLLRPAFVAVMFAVVALESKSELGLIPGATICSVAGAALSPMILFPIALRAVGSPAPVPEGWTTAKVSVTAGLATTPADEVGLVAGQISVALIEAPLIVHVPP